MPGSAEGVAPKPPSAFAKFRQRFHKDEKPGKLTRRELLLALGTAVGIQLSVSVVAMSTEALLEKNEGFESIPAEVAPSWLRIPTPVPRSS
jgi:hypothetical protein